VPSRGARLRKTRCAKRRRSIQSVDRPAPCSFFSWSLLLRLSRLFAHLVLSLLSPLTFGNHVLNPRARANCACGHVLVFPLVFFSFSLFPVRGKRLKCNEAADRGALSRVLQARVRFSLTIDDVAFVNGRYLRFLRSPNVGSLLSTSYRCCYRYCS
jgi:hypothetical protein